MTPFSPWGPRFTPRAAADAVCASRARLVAQRSSHNQRGATPAGGYPEWSQIRRVCRDHRRALARRRPVGELLGERAANKSLVTSGRAVKICRMTTTPPPPPGWYPDPDGGPNLRWFNGTAWTHQYQPPNQQLAAPSPAQSGRITIHYGFALLAILSLLGTLGIGIPMLLSAGSADDGTDAGKDVAGIGSGMATLWMLWGGMWTIIWLAFAINHTLKARR